MFIQLQVEMATSKTAVALTSLCNAIQIMNERLTHIYLAHNRLAGIPQLVTSLSVALLNFPSNPKPLLCIFILFIESLSKPGSSRLIEC